MGFWVKRLYLERELNVFLRWRTAAVTMILLVVPGDHHLAMRVLFRLREGVQATRSVVRYVSRKKCCDKATGERERARYVRGRLFRAWDTWYGPSSEVSAGSRTDTTHRQLRSSKSVPRAAERLNDRSSSGEERQHLPIAYKSTSECGLNFRRRLKHLSTRGH